MRQADAPHIEAARMTTSTPPSYRYDAFISYRHVEPDRAWAKW
jgi:hypothetical protein